MASDGVARGWEADMLALTDTQETLWWTAIGLGFVVVLAVAALLTILVVLVRTIDRRVDAIKATLEQAKANTDDTALIAETAARVDAVLAEGLEHHLFLGRVLDKVRS
jgi:Na+-transporting methylmalonyl-CoA/oxaloacetate decarboxylase gamma subunit